MQLSIVVLSVVRPSLILEMLKYKKNCDLEYMI